MRSAVKKFGGSAGIIIPRRLLDKTGVRTGDSVELRVEDGRLVMERMAAPRQGWADDAKELARESRDELVWPEFANDEDDKLRW